MSNAFYDMPEPFFTGDILSANKMTRLMSCLDYVYGLDQRLEMSHGDVERQPGTLSNESNDGEWVGWVAFTGDQIVVRFKTQETGRKLYFDYGGDHQQSWDVPQSSQYTLSVNTSGLNRYAVYKLFARDEVDPASTSGNTPYYCYLKDSNSAPINGQFSFAQGTVPDAPEFNALRTAIETLKDQFEQPVPCTRARFEPTDRIIPPPANTPQTNYSVSYFAPYRHTWFKFFANFQGYLQPAPATDETVQWQVSSVTGSGAQTFWSETLTYTNYRELSGEHRVNIGGLGLTVGTWYKWTYSHLQAVNFTGGAQGHTALYWFGQQRFNTAAQYVVMPRFELGDVVNGNAGSGARIDHMVTNLNWLSNNRRRDWNLVQRANRTLNSAVYTETFFGQRVYRWLAYRSTVPVDGDGNPLEADTPEPSLRYGMDQYGSLASANMPKSINANAMLDLDATPIRPGMVFFVQNVDYAIQIPE